MKNLIYTTLILLIMSACSYKEEADEKFCLEGAWSLTHMSTPMGYEYDYPYQGQTGLLIYTPDSMLYSCQLMYTGSGIVVMPRTSAQITLIDLGNSTHMYMEGDERRPLEFVNDSTITIQRSGRISRYKRATDMSAEKIDEIREIISNDLLIDANEEVRHYVLSTRERRLQSTNHRLIYALVGVLVCLLVAIHIAITKHQQARRVAQRLREIEEEHNARPQPVRDAMKEVEREFFSSDYYHQLHRNISNGQRLKADDWQEIERRLNAIYPNFTNHLLSLYDMSDLELQTSLLIKLRISPSDIASVLLRDISTISSTRSRLYHKVFNQKGSSKQWDDFVLSIGN